MKNIKRVLSMVLIAFTVVTATAQQKKKNAISTNKAVEKRLEQMDSFLHLDKTQKKQIRALLLSQMQSKKTKISKKKGAYPYKKGHPSKKVQSDKNLFQKKLKMILTPDQWKRWQQKTMNQNKKKPMKKPVKKVSKN